MEILVVYIIGLGYGLYRLYRLYLAKAPAYDVEPMLQMKVLRIK